MTTTNTTNAPPPPLFTDEEYDDWDARPTLREAWDRLPVVRTIAGFKIRWLGPLVELGYDEWLEDIATEAWEHLEHTGWADLLPEGPLLDRRGRVRADWSRAFKRAVDRLVAAAFMSLETDPDRWASWGCYTLHEPNRLLRAEAERRGWDS